MMAGSFLRAALLRSVVFVICATMLAPILIVMIVSFSGDGYLKFPPQTFSDQWYLRFLTNARWVGLLWNSLLIALMSCVVATAMGFLAAYAMVRGAFSMRKAVMALLLMPLIVPHVVTAIAIYFMSARFNLIGFKPWIALAHAVVALPVVLIILQSALKAVDPNLERAAMIFGCGRAGVFRRVILPLVTPSVVSALLFSFLISFDELVISLFLAGIRSETLPVRIWNSLMLEVEPTIAAVSTLLIAATCLALVIEWGMRRYQEHRFGAKA